MNPLTPIIFLHRAAAVYADRTSIIYETTQFTWKQTYDRCCRLASALRSLNILKNDVVSALAPNIPAMYEMHFAVPMAWEVINAINTRLDAANVATILRLAEAKLLFVDYQYVSVATDALKILASGGIHASSSLPLVVVINDVDAPTGIRLGELEYEEIVYCGDPTQPPCHVEDEWDPIALNYTSGPTSAPKEVVYSHRGAFLSTLTVLPFFSSGESEALRCIYGRFRCSTATAGLSRGVSPPAAAPTSVSAPPPPRRCTPPSPPVESLTCAALRSSSTSSSTPPLPTANR